MATESKHLSRRVFEEIWNDKNLNAVDELMTSSYVHHDPQSPDARGIESYKKFVQQYHAAFPDLHFEIEDELGDEQAAVSRWTATGTHQGNLPGIAPTGRKISVSGMTIARVKDGKFIESWSNWDTLGLMQQLGVIPSADKDRAA